MAAFRRPYDFIVVTASPDLYGCRPHPSVPFPKMRGLAAIRCRRCAMAADDEAGHCDQARRTTGTSPPASPTNLIARGCAISLTSSTGLTCALPARFDETGGTPVADFWPPQRDPIRIRCPLGHLLTGALIRCARSRGDSSDRASPVRPVQIAPGRTSAVMARSSSGAKPGASDVAYDAGQADSTNPVRIPMPQASASRSPAGLSKDREAIHA